MALRFLAGKLQSVNSRIFLGLSTQKNEVLSRRNFENTTSLDFKEEVDFDDKKNIKCVNEVKLMGLVAKTPQQIEVNDSLAVIFPLITFKTYKNLEGLTESRSTWHSLIIRNAALSTFTHKHVGKGARIYIDGFLGYRNTSEEGGSSQRVAEITVQTLILLRKGESN